MPGYLLHLLEGNLFLQKYDKTLLKDCSDEWKNQFLIGCLLPDTAKDKTFSHFRHRLKKKMIFTYPHPEDFAVKYPVSPEHPVLFGYYMHLNLDYHFLDTILVNSVSLYDENRKPTENWTDMKWAHIHKTGKWVNPMEFFSDDYMYGDYTTLNAFLISNYSIRIPKLPPALEEVPDEVHYDDMHEVIEYLQHSIQSSFDQMKDGSDDTEPPELKVFDWEQLLQLIEKEISRISLLLDNPQQKI